MLADEQDGSSWGAWPDTRQVWRFRVKGQIQVEVLVGRLCDP